MITKQKATIKQRKKFIETKFNTIKEEVRKIMKKMVQQRLKRARKVQKDHDFEVEDIM
jgi:hypothetical protein